VADVAIGPFAEEVLFRGFLFLVLRRLGWSFWSAAAASSILFGLAHIQVVWGALLGGASSGAARYELLTAPGQYLMRVAVIAAGGLLFAWIADRWQSLWPAIGLHAAINFWSDLVWGEARLANHLAPESLLWSVASCASLAIVIALTLRRRAAPALPIESGRLAPGPFERRWSD
jgi:membrane protease YdiL (CAAX protease family)